MSSYDRFRAGVLGIPMIAACGWLTVMSSVAFAEEAASPPPPVEMRGVLRPQLGGVDKALVATTQPSPGANLVPNPGFEEPNARGDGPKDWQDIDNLVYHWTTDPAAPQRGKVLKIDTRVLQKQAYDWWVRLFVKKDATLKDAPERIPFVGPGWDTIGGLDGGFYWSGFFPIKPGRAYKVFVDYKGPPGTKVFIRGYEKIEPIFFGDEVKTVQAEFRMARGEPMEDAKGRPFRFFYRYSYSTWFPVGGGEVGKDGWQTYTHAQPRHPTNRELTEDVRFLRVMLYPYWPNAEYYFDNVRVVEVDPAADQGIREHEQVDIDEGKIVAPSKKNKD